MEKDEERHMFFFFNDTATTEIYTLSLHDALPICVELLFGPLLRHRDEHRPVAQVEAAHDPVLQERLVRPSDVGQLDGERSEEHTSELQSRQYLVCRLLLEKKNIISTQVSARSPCN